MAAPKTPLPPLNATLGCPRGVQGHPGSPWQGRGAGTESAGGTERRQLSHEEGLGRGEDGRLPASPPWLWGAMVSPLAQG